MHQQSAYSTGSDVDFQDYLGDATVEVLTEVPKEEYKHMMSFFKECIKNGVIEKTVLKDAFYQIQENYDISEWEALFGSYAKSELRKIFSVAGVTVVYDTVDHTFQDKNNERL